MKISKEWLTGFVDGEGCFYVAVIKNDSLKVGYQVQLEFVIAQHERDVQVLHAIKKYFKCGLVTKNKGSKKYKEDRVWVFRVRKLTNLGEIIIPFFDNVELLTTKKYNYLKFKEVYKLIQSGQHLSEEGLTKIIQIKNTMNRKSLIELSLDKDIVPTLLKDKEDQ